MTLKKIKLTIQYDGRDFHGWQRQPGLRTVQGEIERALKKVFKEEISLYGAGRTDVGVHALGQVAHIKVDTDIKPQAIKYHLKKHLPQDIKISESEEVEESFHARYSAKSKIYKYSIYNKSDMHPILRSYSCQVEKELDLKKMEEGASYFLGRNDFRAFMGPKTDQVKSIREIDSISFEKKGNFIIVSFQGQSFLRNQIRIMMGSLVKVGKGSFPPYHIKEILDSKDKSLAGPTLTPAGLYLVKINY